MLLVKMSLPLFGLRHLDRSKCLRFDREINLARPPETCKGDTTLLSLDSPSNATKVGWVSSRIDRARFESPVRVFTTFSPSAQRFLPVSPVLEAGFRCIDMSARFHRNHHYHVLVFIVSKSPRLVSLARDVSF